MTVRQTFAGKSTVYPTPGKGNDRTILLYNFDIDSPTLKKEHKAVLDRLVVPLLSPRGSTTLIGMASGPGKPKRNDALSVLRAKSVKNYLVLKRPGIIHVLSPSGIGEKGASDLEDEHRRSVLLVVSPDKIRPVPPDKPAVPAPHVPDWRLVRFSMEAEIVDILKLRRLKGELYLAQTPSSYIAWDLFVTGLNFSLGPKGALPFSQGRMFARGNLFHYDFRIFDPFFFWKDEKIVVTLRGTKMDVEIKRALPQIVTPDWRPIRGSGAVISGTSLRFTMDINPGIAGVATGSGNIQKPKKKTERGTPKGFKKGDKDHA